MTSKQIKKKISELEFYLGMPRHRQLSTFPGPGIKEEETKLMQQIKDLKVVLSNKSKRSTK